MDKTMKPTAAALVGLLFGVTACGPQFETEVTLTPPETAEGRTCAAQCQTTEELCRAREDTEVARCEADAERAADRDRRNCERRVDRSLNSCLGGATTPESQNACFVRYGPGSSQREFCDRSPTKWCRPDYGRCTQRFEACFIGCGGQITKRKICVANCDKQ
jgi:hypothetical protein